MLDLTKLAMQMQGISNHLAQEATASQQRLTRAQQILGIARSQQVDLVAKLREWGDRLGFSAAEPVEPLDTRRALPVAPTAHTAIATDGSQISPSHHEIAYCYLLNIGRVVLHYGQGRQPLLDSLPEVFYEAADLYGARQWGIRTEEWMGYRRTVLEAVALAELAASIANRSQIALPPTVALTDGSLIYWFLDTLPLEARDRLLPDILAAWSQLQQLNIPILGYISASRSTESLNFLRLLSCPYLAPDCQLHCQGQTDGAPCQIFSPLRDVSLWATTLEPGERGPLWRSSARILSEYGESQWIYFCYVHGGAEIARVEFPAWVAQDSMLLETALGLVLAQVQKGYGYPVVLAEAHNQAVVRGGDRTRFFALLEQEMLRAGLRNIGTSYKETRKRGSIA